ncbi:cAMP-dependent protein kinase catalytic subunit-like isoform X2 [Varroa destructor]|uniref:Serine/threonine-protein kinase greatwall n=1 Tax=Varroa destructor TaxID=109461 RepID=A0A7M7JQK6_VARDE|nr:cAMP-dependent protein kinase catalytic subunit-like isoform X2 [Varroa destructor]
MTNMETACLSPEAIIRYDPEQDPAAVSAKAVTGAAVRTTHALKHTIRYAIKKLHDEQPSLVSSVQAGLEIFVRTERPMVMTRFPREHFAQEQHCLVAIDYYERINRKRLNFLDIREDLGNLACLHEYFIGRDDRAAAVAARLLHKLLQIMSEFAMRIEHNSRMRKTNWQAVVDMYAAILQDPDANAAYVILPKLRHIFQLRLMGAGGFGAIYKVQVGGISVIGKLVPCNKFKTTRQASADKLVGSMVNSPFLVRYHTCFRSDQAYVTLMEYIRGVDLHKLLKSTRLSDKVNKLIMAQLGLALQYLHYRGFLHRDVKPSNLMIAPGGKLKLIDFDTCKISAGRFINGHINSYIRKSHNEFDDAESAGTLYFLPPEILDKKPYGRAIDWWAVGVTSYRLCAGKLPFRAGTRKALKEKIREGDVGYGLGEPAHEELTKRLLIKDPMQRITSGRFEEFRNHDWFSTVDWAKIETEQFIEDIAAVNDMMDFRDGQYSPKDEFIVIAAQKQQEALSFADLDEIEPQDQEPLFTLLSWGFQSAMAKLQSGIAITESDIYEEPELVKDNFKFCKYKFQKFLQLKTQLKPFGHMSPQMSTSVGQFSDL